MNGRPVGRIDQAANSLAELRFEGQTIDTIVGHIGEVAVESLVGWDAVATSLVTGDEIATYGATDPRVNPVDQAQYDFNRGPCVDAIKKGEIQYFDGASIEPRWRQFAEVAAEHDVYSVFSVPLRLDGEVLGAINFYSRERDALRPGHKEEGSVFGAQAAIALANAQAYLQKEEQLGQLEEALASRTMIGQATGLLMAQEGMSSEEAFQKLVKVSQNSNIKLREIAQRYVNAWETKTESTNSLD